MGVFHIIVLEQKEWNNEISSITLENNGLENWSGINFRK